MKRHHVPTESHRVPGHSESTASRVPRSTGDTVAVAHSTVGERGSASRALGGRKAPQFEVRAQLRVALPGLPGLMVNATHPSGALRLACRPGNPSTATWGSDPSAVPLGTDPSGVATAVDGAAAVLANRRTRRGQATPADPSAAVVGVDPSGVSRLPLNARPAAGPRRVRQAPSPARCGGPGSAAEEVGRPHLGTASRQAFRLERLPSAHGASRGGPALGPARRCSSPAGQRACDQRVTSANAAQQIRGSQRGRLITNQGVRAW